MSRRKGSIKTGGRLKGTKNRRTQELEKAVSSTGITPLAYLLEVLRDKEQPVVMRIDAAKAACPYIHPRRLPEVAEGKPGGTILLSVNVNPLSREDE